INAHVPFWVGAGAVLLAAGVLAATRAHLPDIDAPEPELDELTDRARAVTVGNDS
ncbi:MAG: MFS transporter, partial [Mycobacterium sp.]